MTISSRTHSVEAVAELVTPPHASAEKADISGFGEDVFGTDAMHKYLPKDICEKLLRTIHDGEPIDSKIAGEVAQAMREWALDRGATHFTHWFLPLNGSTAEKHDAFLDYKNAKPVLSFSAENLIVGEPDASSFPNGGLRSTFEARGYTAWDPTSPAFIKRHGNGATLCIPTAFCSYSGESLDKKTPLLRSQQVLCAATHRLMKCFGIPEQHFSVTLGAEQEYFLIDRHFYLQRPDLIQCGRTVFGAAPAKHQQLEDHYFGSIKMRVLNFMTEVERELWSLGIPAKTRHNEAAPAQFELAPLFEDLNLACDHNMLVMEVLRQVAERNGLVCLLHEKPFEGVNGSGKHNNWSVSYGGRNLLSPGVDPGENAIFLTILSAIIMAVDNHADLLRATVAGIGNDHRLGAHEAPPAIISIFLGDELTQIIDNICDGKSKTHKESGFMQIGVDTLPPLPRGTTDRNRTSPFAFTGNKFEFRAPGSSQSCADPCTMLNIIVADAFNDIASKLETLDCDFNDGLQSLLRTIISKHRRVIFNGDGYGEAWLKEAAKRGLPNAGTTMEALDCLKNPANIELCAKYGVYNARELESRYEVFASEYRRRLRIEGGIALEIAQSMIAPAVISELSEVAAALKNLRKVDIAAGQEALEVRTNVLGENLNRLYLESSALKNALNVKNTYDILASMARIRKTVDNLEAEVADDRWPLPKYREMLFLY